MLAEIGGYGQKKIYEQEEVAYLKSLVKSNILSDDTVTNELFSGLDNDVEALEIAIGLEKDSILFYYQLQDITKPKEQKLLGGIIAEEKTHLRDLSEMKQQLSGLQDG
jgi:hypothetical protein